MAQSLSMVIIHIIFSTKDRVPMIGEALRPRLHAFLAELARARGGNAYRVGGTADHVHIVTTLPRTITQSKLVEDVKRESSKWVKEQGPEHRGFYWQRGYGVFSLSRSHLAAAVEYVEGQEEHHRQKTFQDEFRAFLKRYGVEYDERYVWE